MELYVCGFNAHHQLIRSSRDDFTQFQKACRSPYLQVRCALWSCTVVENDGSLIHNGFRLSGLDPMLIEGPPPRNIKVIFGDTSGVLGALTTDGSLYVYYDEPIVTKGPELKKYHFDEDSFISKQNLAIDHLAIADNGEVCIITSARQRVSSGCTPALTDETPQFTFEAPTAKLEIHSFACFEALLSADPPTSTLPIFSSIVSLLASATSFTALTSSGEVLTFGSALHPQTLGRTPTPSRPANSLCPVPFLGGMPIRKVAVGGWIGAAVSEDNDLYVWGGQAGEAKRIESLPKLSDGEDVKLVDINGGVDVVDVGVGSGHILALTGDGEVWVTGDGECGQLGTGSKAFEEDWVRARGEWEGRGKVVGVGCGVWCSWIIIDTKIR